MNLSKEHCNCAFFSFEAFFCCLKLFVVNAYHLEIYFLHQHGVHSASWRRTTVFGSWEPLSRCVTKSYVHPRPAAAMQFSPARVHLSKRSSHDCGLVVFCQNMTWTRSPCILSRPNCTPEASYLIHSWFHWGCVECKKKRRKKRN